MSKSPAVTKYGKVSIVKSDFNFAKVKGFVGFKILAEVPVGAKMSSRRFKKSQLLIHGFQEELKTHSEHR